MREKKRRLYKLGDGRLCSSMDCFHIGVSLSIIHTHTLTEAMDITLLTSYSIFLSTKNSLFYQISSYNH